MLFKGASIVFLSLILLLIFNQAKTQTRIPRVTKVSAVYVRYGVEHCNVDTSELVYTGIVAGGSNTHNGGGTNSLCLPVTPEYDYSLIASGSSQSSVLYGATFHTSAYSPWSEVHNGAIMCAVCLTRGGRSTTLMIPAKSTCPTGWIKEYGGLLMGSHKDHSNGHDYLCVDGNPEARARSTNDGNLFYPTEAMCGVLPCPPYSPDKEIACVVCSR